MEPKRRTPRDTTGDNNETISPNMEQLIAQRVAAAMEQYEANQNSGGGNVAVPAEEVQEVAAQPEVPEMLQAGGAPIKPSYPATPAVSMAQRVQWG
ncbi:hypothetical protein L1987_13135 [Smallanthus sonchifolius]|uniref:Uncharacterized protein n=1 Tax=Smallanthus sonchifolius TaxID=185202 RepID=A0ACB9JFM6_9ASTR|nr:hypothetical protein L1987_13135 [Smallanthus sonchifolius]